MKKLITLLILVFTINLSAQIKNEYYENGKIKATGNLKKDLKDGKWEEYYENGKIKTIGNYINGEKNGSWKLYFENGKLAAAGDYQTTKFPKDGTWKFYSKEGIEKEFYCPEPSKDTYAGVCIAMFQRSEAQNPDNGLGLRYQERLWQMSCTNPGIDSKDIAAIRIQIMWNKFRENFRCYNIPNSIATDMNILKFSMDIGFTSFIHEAVRRYHLDVNFIDPADGKTVLDFVTDQEILIRKTPPVNTSKADEYQTIYKMLRTNGAKHSQELNK